MKRMISIVLCLMLVFGMVGTVFAGEQSCSKENYNMVNSGYLRIDGEGKVAITDKYVTYVKQNLKDSGVNAEVLVEENTIIIRENSTTGSSKLARGAKTSGGVTKVEWLSFNRFKIYLNNELSNKIAGGAGVGAALSVWIPEATVSKILASALGASAGLIVYNNKGKGVIVSGIFSINPPLATFYWIKSQ